MKRLIVNADDFGLTKGINEGIIKCFKEGIITSASVMSNMPGFYHAVNLAKEHPNLAVGIHLNIVKGKSLEQPGKAFSLIDGNGYFYSLPGLIKRLFLRKIEFSEIENELRAQLEKVLKTNLRITHIDSHRHFHIYPSILDIVIKLAKEYKIMKIRCPLDVFSHPRNIKELSLKLLSQRCSGVLKQNNIRYNQRFYDLVKVEKNRDVSRSFSILCRKIPCGVTEISCHPGFDTNELDGIEKTIHNREKQITMLIDPAISKIINVCGIKLTTYADSLE